MTAENRNQAFPPKSYSIDMLVTKPQDVEKVINGQKTATRRNGRYADIGEVMELGDHHFKIDNVYEQTLGEVTDQDARQEGFKNLEEYKQAILSLHPGMRWAPKMKVWVHEFSPADE